MTGLAGYTGALLTEAARWSVKPTPAGRLTWKTDPALRGPPPARRRFVSSTSGRSSRD